MSIFMYFSCTNIGRMLLKKNLIVQFVILKTMILRISFEYSTFHYKIWF